MAGSVRQFPRPARQPLTYDCVQLHMCGLLPPVRRPLRGAWLIRTPLTPLLMCAVLAAAAPAAFAQSTSEDRARVCPVSADPAYGLTIDMPVRVGGGAMYVAARERGYLQGLRGPSGEAVSFRRTGSTPLGTRPQPVDVWEITWDGAGQPVTIYIDAYRFGMPKAPVGLTCVGFATGVPPVDLMLADELQTALAVERGTEQSTLAPIPLGHEGDRTPGVAFDRFRMLAVAARLAAASGQPFAPDSEETRRASTSAYLTLVAFPGTCGGQTVPPVAIEMVNPRSGPVSPRESGITGEALVRLLPGATLPAGAIGVVMPLFTFRPDDVVRVLYDPVGCEAAERVVTSRVTVTPARAIEMPTPVLPEGVARPDEPLWLQVVIDIDGTFRVPRYLGGPEALMDRALDTLRSWRAEPARVNGTPVVFNTLVAMRFE